MTSTLVCYFDDYTEAKDAERDLLENGLERDDVTLVYGETEASAGSESIGTEKHLSFWDRFKQMLGFAGDEQRAYYEEATRRGGVLLMVRAADNQIDRAADIVERHHPVDIDQRAEEWRASGWTGYAPGSEISKESSLSSTATLPSSMGSTSTYSSGATTSSMDTLSSTSTGMDRPVVGTLDRTQERAASVTGGSEVTIPVVEEQLKVGTRVMRRGALRVHTYVTEIPVEQQVALRREEARVERRTTDRPVTASDDVFRERTIEVTESVEEPVVAKEARVVEEIVVSKEQVTDVGTVRDRVRRTDVEFEEVNEEEDVDDETLKSDTEVRPHP